MRILSRTILALMLLLAAAILLFGPRGRAQPPSGSTVVTYWEKWGGEEGRQMRVVVDAFNRTVGREKKIFVNYLPISQVDRKSLISIAGGVPPDIIGLWQKDIVPFAARGAVLPLDELAARHGIGPDTYKRVYREMCTYDGRLYAMISTPATVALHLNRHHQFQNAARLAAEGLDATRPPASIQELDRYALVLDRFDASGQLLRAGYLPMEPGWYITLTPFWFGGDLWDPANGRFFFDTPATIRAFEWVQTYPRRLGAAAMSEFSSQFGNFDSPTNAFLAEKVSMIQQGPWMANFIHNNRPILSEFLVPKSVEPLLPRAVRPFNYAWAVEAFPTDGHNWTDVTFADADVLLIPRGARHPDEAFEFIAYLQRQDVMEQLTSMHCKPSPLASVSDEFIRRHPNPYIAVFDRLARSPNARGQIKSPLQQEIGAELEVAIQSLYLLNATAPQAMNDLQSRAQRKWKEYQQRLSARAGER